jgi:hypothetical protein
VSVRNLLTEKESLGLSFTSAASVTITKGRRPGVHWDTPTKQMNIRSALIELTEVYGIILNSVCLIISLSILHSPPIEEDYLRPFCFRDVGDL